MMDTLDPRSMQIEAVRCLLRNLLAVPYREFATFGMMTMVAVSMTYNQYQSLKHFAHDDQEEHSNGNCTFCPAPAAAEHYVSPAMCDRHIIAAVIVARIVSLRLPVVAENIRQIVALYPQIGLPADEAVELCKPMISDNGGIRI